MKKIIFLVAIVVVSVTAYSQTGNKHDVVLKINGDELTGHVNEITDSDIKFVHDGETLVYTIKKIDILKITFASGRIEFFNKPSLPSESKEEKRDVGSTDRQELQQTLQDHHNKVAVLPFKYLVDKKDAGEEMTYKVQSEAYVILEKNNASLQIQDPTTTNALLIKAGITNDNVRGYTMGEICNILGVEYVVQGTITQDRTAQVSTQYSSSSSKYNSENDSHKSSAIGSIFSSSSKSSSATSSSTYQNYKTGITMNVFTDKGNNVFSQSHDSIWSTNEAYKITLQYLLKRAPIYRK